MVTKLDFSTENESKFIRFLKYNYYEGLWMRIEISEKNSQQIPGEHCYIELHFGELSSGNDLIFS